MSRTRLVTVVLALVVMLVGAGTTGTAIAVDSGASGASGAEPAPAAAPAQPHIFFYNLDDLREKLPGQMDPLDFMPKARAWMSSGTRFGTTVVADPSCCPSRAALMTGRFPHSNGVRLQSQGPLLDSPWSMGCYLQRAGYATYTTGKFLTSWQRAERPPCYDHATLIWGGYRDVASRVDGRAQKLPGYSTTALGQRSRDYLTSGLDSGRPVFLYEAPQAPHWVDVTLPDGSRDRLALPDTAYADAPVPQCAGPGEADRTDKPAYVTRQQRTTAQSQRLCASQLRAILSADDEFDATMTLLQQRGVLSSTLVVLGSDNGYMWGEHGRTEKFVPYEPSIRVPLFVRWPGHVAAGVDEQRLVSYLDILPTLLEAAGVTVPAAAPPLEGESLLQPGTRTTLFSEYFTDPANGKVPTWRLARTATAKYVQTYAADGSVAFREYYDLVADPGEQVNLLGDADATNDPPAWRVTQLRNRVEAFATCRGAACIR